MEFGRPLGTGDPSIWSSSAVNRSQNSSVKKGNEYTSGAIKMAIVKMECIHMYYS